MMTKLNNLSLGLAVRAQTALLHGTSRVVERAPASRRSRAEIGAGLAIGLISADSAAFASGANSAAKSQGNITSLIANVGGFMSALVAFGSVCMLAYAALLYVGSGGNKTATDKAKAAVKNVVIGLGLAAGIYIVRSFIVDMVGSVGGDKGGQQVRDTLTSKGALTQAK